MKFIKLNRIWLCTGNKDTGINNPDTTTEYYINTEYIRSFNYDEESNRTRLRTYDNIDVWIKETPEEILELVLNNKNGDRASNTPRKVK